MRRFLVAGQTGVGKSSFINATFGLHLAKTSKFEPCTKVVEHYAYGTPFGNVCLIDTPGLSEETEDIDKAYLQQISSAIAEQRIDITLYLSRLNDNRFRPSEKKALILLTNELGSDIWNNAWLVLTFAASVPTYELSEAYKHKVSHIDSFLKQITLLAARVSSFQGFKKVILMDNIVRNWTATAVPISSILVN